MVRLIGEAGVQRVGRGIIGSFRPLFLSVEFSDRGKISNLPPTVGGKSLIFPRSKNSTPFIKGILGYL